MIINVYSSTTRKEYRERAAERYYQEYGEDFNALSMKLQNKYLTKFLESEARVQSKLINQGIDLLELGKLEKELKAKGDPDPRWHAYVALRKKQNEAKKARKRVQALLKNVKKVPTLKQCLAVLVGISIFGIIWWVCLDYGMSLINIKDGDYAVPKLMLQFWGFVLVLGGPLLGGILALYIYILICSLQKFVCTIKGMCKSIWEDKWIFIVCVVGFIATPFIIWWFCVDLTPWKIFIAPGMILALIAGKRR